MLLLEGKPYWDTKFLVRTLSADRSIELTSVVQMAEGRLLQRKIPRRAPAAGKAGRAGAVRPLLAQRALAAGKPDSPSAPPLPLEMFDDNVTYTPPQRGGHIARRGGVPRASHGRQHGQAGRSPSGRSRGGAGRAGHTDAPGEQEQWTIAKDAGRYLADAAALGGYQIVILGRNAEAFLTDDGLATLRKWLVEGEGSLVCFRGPPASQIGQRLGELMPVRWTPAAESRFRVALTGGARRCGGWARRPAAPIRWPSCPRWP